MEQLIEQLIKDEEITIDMPLCQNWNTYYTYVPWNMGDPDEDEDYFEVEDLDENSPAKVELEISGLEASNKEEFLPTLHHLFKNAEFYENAILECLLNYTFGDEEDKYGYESALELANRADNNQYTKEEFIKRSCSLSTISIKNIGKDTLNYISFYLDCGWDDEHGVTVICLDGKGIITSHGADLASRNGENLISAINYELEN